MFIGKVKGLPTYSDKGPQPPWGLITHHILHLYTDNFLVYFIGPPRQLCNLHTIKNIYK